MRVGGRGVLVGHLAMFVSCGGVLLRLVMLAKRVVMFCLMLVMCRGVMMGGCQMMMFAGRMFRCLCHIRLLGLVVPS